MALKVATYEQILKILSQLAENYSNFFDVYYEMFFSPTPSNVVLKVYDENGQQQTITLPNRAKDRSYIFNGEGNPNGVLTSPKGSIYQDILNGAFYLNVDGTVNGWSQIIAKTILDEIIMSGSAHPEGNVTASKGTLFTDKQNGVLYIKTTETGNKGWLDVSADLDGVATTSLNNLTEEGEKHFANLSLSDLNDEGENRFTQKENIANKVLVVAEYSTDEEYPSAKAVYTALTNGLDTREKLSNKTTVINFDSTDAQYPSAKAVYNVSSSKEDAVNKVSTITESSTGVQYPSARAVYNLGVTKADIDLGNASNTALGNLLGKAQESDKETLANWLSPNYDAEIEWPKSDGISSYDGWLIFNTAANTAAFTITIGGHTFNERPASSNVHIITFPISKNDAYACSNWGLVSNLYLVPVKGESYGS